MIAVRIKKSTRMIVFGALFVATFAVLGVSYLLMTGAAPPKASGDLNQDSKVNIYDLSILLGKFNKADTAADVNGDAKVTILDLSILLSNYGKALPAENGPWHIIYLDKLTTEDKAMQQYHSMQQNPYVVPAFRSDSPSMFRKWEQRGYNYYYMSVSSDFTTCTTNTNPYRPASEVMEALNGKYSRGLYFHEVGAIYACANGWNWDAAVRSINWPLMNQYVTEAKARGKKVVWAEPAAGWQTLKNHPVADSYLRAWGNTLVPTFASNFSHAPTNKVVEARRGAVDTAIKYDTEFGESVQSWYWIDPGWPYTSQDAKVLSEYGKHAGATYFEIEGTWEDMSPGTTYMNGVNAFIRELGPTSQSKQYADWAPLPTYH
jgi:Dockerin type I domain